MYILIIGRNALIEVIFEIVDRGVFEVMEAERRLNCGILTANKIPMEKTTFNLVHCGVR